MPVKVFNFLPTLLNRANDISMSGFNGVRTLDEINAGGLNLGDAMDFTNWEAASQSDPAIGMLFEGRYRRIKVDDECDPDDVDRGTAAFIKPGTRVFSVLVLTPGSGQTPGEYMVKSTGGGTPTSQAVIRVFVSTAGTVIVPPEVVASGSGFTSKPTFTLTGAGGTAATFQAQMDENTYIVTGAQTTGINLSAGRGLFLNKIDPGNYGWIQESGIGGFLMAGGGAIGGLLTPNNEGKFTAAAAGPPPVASFGVAIDQPVANAVIRGKLNLLTFGG